MKINQEKIAKLDVAKYFIIYFDILGYKDNVNRYGDKQCLKPIYLSVNMAIEDYLSAMNAKFALSSKIKAHYRVFSDNIIIAVKKSKNPLENIYALYLILLFTKDLQLVLSLEFNIFIRGCAHFGNLYFDKTILFGSGLIEAVEYENRAKYPRIILTDELLKYLKECSELELSDEFISEQITRQSLEKLKTDVKFGENDSTYYTAKNVTYEFVMTHFNRRVISPQTRIGTVLKYKSKDVNERIFNLYRDNFRGFLNDILNFWFKLDDEIYFLNYLDSYTYTDHKERHEQNINLNLTEYDKIERVKEKYEWVKEYHLRFFSNSIK